MEFDKTEIDILEINVVKTLIIDDISNLISMASKIGMQEGIRIPKDFELNGYKISVIFESGSSINISVKNLTSNDVFEIDINSSISYISFNDNTILEIVNNKKLRLKEFNEDILRIVLLKFIKIRSMLKLYIQIGKQSEIKDEEYINQKNKIISKLEAF